MILKKGEVLNSSLLKKKISTQRVNVIIVNYNSWNYTLACIKSLKKSSYKHTHIYLLDNASTDGSVYNIEKWFKKTNAHYNLTDVNGLLEMSIDSRDKFFITIIKNKLNLGFGAGNNIVIKYLLKSNVEEEYIWLLNPDTIVEENVMLDLVMLSSENRNVIYGNLICYFALPNEIMYCGGFKVKKFVHGIKRIKNYSEINQLSAIAGTSLFMKIRDFKNLGLLPEDYFMYWEETDFCTKAKLNGYSFDVNCKSKIYDHVGGSTKDNFLREYLYLLNGLKYYRKYYPNRIILIVLSSLLKLLNAMINGNKTKAKAFFWAHIDFFKHLFGKKIDVRQRIEINTNAKD